MASPNLGIYFGEDKISIVEVIGRKIISHIRIPLNIKVEDKLQAKLPEVAAIIAHQAVRAIDEALKANNIRGKNVSLSLSRNEQFIRSFTMPILNKSEIDIGVQFEAKKYVPFKVEDLSFDYLPRVNKKSSKMDILFTACLKHNLDNTVNLLKEAGLETVAVEPANLGLLRFLPLTKQFDPKLSCALVAVQDEEAEFIIIDKGFPLFSRDLRLIQETDEPVSNTAAQEDSLRKRLTAEIRVSLDYYRRQFQGSSIDKILFLSRSLSMQEALVAGLSQDLSIKVERLEVEKDKEIGKLDDLDMLKAYALTLRGKVGLPLWLDLAKKKYVQPIVEEAAGRRQFAFNVSVLKLPFIIAFGAVGFAYFSPQVELNKFKQELQRLQAEANQALPQNLKALANDGLKTKKNEYNQKIEVIQKLLSSRWYTTPALNALPSAVSKGLWIESVDIARKEEAPSVKIRGLVYLEDPAAEKAAVQGFLRELRDNTAFMQGLGNLEIGQITQREIKGYLVTVFDMNGN